MAYQEGFWHDTRPTLIQRFLSGDSSRQTGNSVLCVRPSPRTKPIKRCPRFREGIFSFTYRRTTEFRNSLSRPAPSAYDPLRFTAFFSAPLLLLSPDSVPKFL